MVKALGRVWRSVAIAMTVVLGVVSLPHAASAAGPDTTVTKPERRVMDALGIDLTQLAYVKENTHLSVGDPAHGGLSWRYIPGASSYAGNVVEFLSGSNKLTTVKFEGNATVFINNSGTYTNASGTGATLTKTASNYIFTDDDGTVYTYSWTYTAGISGNPSYNAGPLLSVQKPDGSVLTMTGATVNGSPATVISNRGYGLKSVNSGGVTTVYAVNMAVHTCDASLNCNAYDGSITLQQVYNASAPLGITGDGHVDQVTDALGNNWQYFVDFSADIVTQTTETFGPKVLWYYQDPTGYSATINYDGDGRITTFVDPRGTFTFNYNGQTLAQAATVSDRNISVYDPSGALMYSAYTHWKQSTVDWTKDALGHQTT